jgi:class 3 adenylate cyclase
MAPSSPAPLSTHAARRVALAWLAPWVVASALAGAALAPWLDGPLYDAQTRLLRAVAPQPAPEVVIVGIDQASVDAVPLPLALWHQPLGSALGAIASAGPRVVGVDIVLPERSYEAISPGLDRALLRGIVRAREAGGVVLALQPAADGRGLRAIHPPFIAAAGAGGTGAALFPVERDGAVRRVDAQLSTFIVALAARLGATAGDGLIDYTRGGAFTYVPLHAVLQAAEVGDAAQLVQWFAGRPVLLGSVLPLTDRRAQPASLAAWESPRVEPPGVLIHAQALRSLLGAGLIQPAGAAWTALAVLVLLLPTVVPWQGARFAALFVLLAASFVGAAALLRAGMAVPLALAWITGIGAATARSAMDAWQARRERDRLRQAFAGVVSPGVFDDLVSGRLPTRGRTRAAVLFADVRGFTAMSEHNDAAQVLDLLNRYYAAVTPVLHAHGAAIDSFRGDGITAVFGAPRALPDAPRQALAAARALLAELARFNATLERDGSAPLTVGIGLSWGEVVFGALGSPERRSFTVIGDAVNVAARLQDLTKVLPAPILVSAALRDALPAEDAARLHDFGQQPIRGHSPVYVWGWRA